MTGACFFHSSRATVVACPVPDSGDEFCHQCGAVIPAPLVPPTVAEHVADDRRARFAGSRRVRFCTNHCAGRWDAEHPGFFA